MASATSIFPISKTRHSGTNNLVDRIGILQDVGASYILLRALESNTTIYADIYSIKFVTISNASVSNNQYYNLYNNSMF